jgi:hypothetical protein
MSLIFEQGGTPSTNDNVTKRSDLSEDQLAAVGLNKIRTAHLFRAIFTNSTNGGEEEYNLTDYHRDILVDDTVYSALGSLIAFGGLLEDTENKINSINVSLSGIDSTMISVLLQYYFIDRKIEIWRAFFQESDDTMIDDPVKIFDGRMDEPVITEDPDQGTVTVAITAANHFVDFMRRPGRHTNNEEQQSYFLGDRFFEHVGKVDKELIWGRRP